MKATTSKQGLITNQNLDNIFKTVNPNQNYAIQTDEIDAKKTQYGFNETKQKKYNFVLGFLRNLFSPFNIILLVINVYNLYELIKSDDGSFVISLIQVVIITIMILISVLIGYVQEIKTFYYAKSSKESIVLKTTVIRNVNVTSINNVNYLKLLDKKEIVERSEIYPGDLVFLKTGDIIPADLKVVYANNLTVNQSNLTGESYPVSKGLEKVNDKVLERQDICFQNTIIASGFMFGVVLKTGKNVIFSKIENSKKSRSKDAFYKSLWKISVLLIAYTIVMCSIIFALKGITTHDYKEALVFAVAIAIGITPEMLPIIVSTNLLNGIKKLPKQKILVKNLSSMQNFGAMDVLCLDKTGTITNGYIILDDVINFTKTKELEIKEKLFFATKLQSGFYNSIDKAIMDKFSGVFSNPDYEKVDELPFDFKRKRSSLLLEKEIEHDEKYRFIFTKGSFENVFPLCTKIDVNDEVEDLTDERRADMNDVYEKFSNRGFRVIVLAEKKVAIADEEIAIKDESDMVFLGFAVFTDKPKKQSKHFLKKVISLNVDLKILTGDSETITRNICVQNDFRITGVVDGKTLDDLPEDQWQEVVDKNNVFVKLDPIQKQRIIKTLKSLNKIVGYIGDGGNDIPSFKEADLAISFGDSDINVHSQADVIIYHDNLNSIQEAISQGRLNFANILKYMKITISSNIGNMISVIVASLWLPFLPMLGIQILLQNLIYDISQFSLIGDNVDPPFLNNPQRLSIKRVLYFSLFNGPVSSIFDIVTYAILFFGFGFTHKADESMFNSGWFMVGLLTQTFVILTYRTSHANIFKLKIRMPIYISILVVVAIALILPFTILGDIFSLGVLNPIFIPIGLAILLGYLLVSIGVKALYIKLFKNWL